MSRTRAMSSHHTAQLLDAVMHYLPLDVRYQVMREVPAAYNAWAGREVMVAVRAEEVEAAHEREQ